MTFEYPTCSSFEGAIEIIEKGIVTYTQEDIANLKLASKIMQENPELLYIGITFKGSIKLITNEGEPTKFRYESPTLKVFGETFYIAVNSKYDSSDEIEIGEIFINTL